VEGSRLSNEVIQAGSPVELVFHTEYFKAKEPGLVNMLARLGGEIQLVSEAVMAACSDTENPAGILVVVPFPDLEIPQALTLTLVVDQMADPGNLGTLLRTAWAVGVEVVFLTKGCVDPFNPKVVRAGAGAQLRLPILEIDSHEVADRVRGLELLAAESRGGIEYHKVDWRKPSALIIGSESHGIGDALADAIKERVHIPMREGVESLNAAVAASVILFEIARQREAI
jgi:TrmH family RNA methyltransferase